MKVFLAFVRKEFYHVFRDRKTLLLLFGLPIAQIILFGFALTNEIKDSSILICDYAQDETSHQITDKLAAGDHFILKKQLLSHREILEEFKAGNIKMAVVFPPNFQHDLYHENRSQIQLISDASDPNIATTISNYARQIILDYQQSLIPDHNLPYSINVETRMIYNPELKGTTNFVPGVMALVLLLICVLMTSVSIVKEKEMGTMEVLLVSPFNPILVILSKAVPYLVLSLVNLIIILLLSIYLLDMPINGSIVLLFAVSALLIITALSMGLLISNVTNSQQAAMLVSLMGMLLPTMIFTGFMFPIENMPIVLQVISNIVPSKWYYIIVKSIMIKGLGFAAIWKETLILMGMTLVLLALSIKNFKTRLA
ncbi:ABC transporter permease [Echinicola shivajiensis]|uniref:ABC transporter permease n=1 Tax=Echinicola shivajiensis TaxID=1035916 RepID=UPI001BFBF68F|nr:ABC transporter permease [Echinicola shivajiensis]